MKTQTILAYAFSPSSPSSNSRGIYPSCHVGVLDSLFLCSLPSDSLLPKSSQSLLRKCNRHLSCSWKNTGTCSRLYGSECAFLGCSWQPVWRPKWDVGTTFRTLKPDSSHSGNWCHSCNWCKGCRNAAPKRVPTHSHCCSNWICILREALITAYELRSLTALLFANPPFR